MSDRPYLSRLTLRNLLSFGPEGVDVELRDLNVLIGPNTSGKSNFIDALSLLGALPLDLSVPVRGGGGIHEWLWRGGGRMAGAPLFASLEAQLSCGDEPPLRHRLELRADGARAQVADESIEAPHPAPSRRYFAHVDGKPKILKSGGELKYLNVTNLRDDQSILAQRNNPEFYPTLSTFRSFYDNIRVYRDWDTGRHGPLRTPQPADLPQDFLMPGAENLGVVLNNLQRHTEVWEALNARLARLHPSLREVKTLVQANTVQVMLREADLKTLTPATRMSDGTLRWLALLAVLLHPEPPAMVCIEEPELGLHPDLIDDLAKLLVEASQRTQLVVTTHSDHLVNALSPQPGSVIVVEREPGGTALRRLDPERLAGWLEKYRLGELWMKGEIGGTRW